MRTTRRAFLGTLLGIPFTPLAPPSGPAAPTPRLRRAMAQVGRRYLAHHPREASVRRLKRGLGGGPAMTLAEAVAAAVSRRPDDFARGDTVLVAGWLLARSEARACALAALAGGRAHVA